MAAADRLPTQETMSIETIDGIRHFTLTADNQKHFKSFKNKIYFNSKIESAYFIKLFL